MHRLLLCTLVLVSCVCGAHQLSEQDQTGFGSAKYVLVLGCDGMGADYLIQANNTPNFDSLRAEGSSTFNARNVWPTWSLPNWAAIVNSVGTEESGVYGNSWYDTSNCIPYGTVYQPPCLICETCETAATGILAAFQYLPGVYNMTEAALDALVAEECAKISVVPQEICESVGDHIVSFVINGGLLVSTDASQVCEAVGLCARTLRPITGPFVPSLFGVAKRALPGIQAAVFTDWTGINQLVEPNTVDFFRYANAGPPTRSSIIVSELIQVVENYTPEIVFIHFDDIDESGHAHGWGSEQYYEAISLVDYEVGLLISAYEKAGILDDTLILTIADHGGQQAGHGYTNQKNVAIPWIAKGPSVLSNHTISSYVRNLDIPATALYALGVNQPNIWVGRPAAEIYTGEPYQSPPAASSALVNTTIVTVVISGLNSAGFKLAPAPTLKHLAAQGSFAQHARAQMPSTTLTNIASIIMGSGPEETGVCQGPFPDANSCEWNGVHDSLVPPISGVGALFPSIFQVLSEHNVNNTGAVYRFANISKLIQPTLEYNSLVDTDQKVASTARTILNSAVPPTYLFAQFWDVQEAAVKYGYQSAEYLIAIEKVDLHVATIKNSLPKNSLLIVTSDHGGFGTTNGELNDASIIIPFIAYGPQIVKTGYRIPTHTRNMDAASIALYSLGIQQPTYWVGNSHPEIFVQ